MNFFEIMYSTDKLGYVVYEQRGFISYERSLPKQDRDFAEHLMTIWEKDIGNGLKPQYEINKDY